MLSCSCLVVAAARTCCSLLQQYYTHELVSMS
mgnify:CR=1 FL=1